MKKLLLSSFAFLLFTFTTTAQVGIGTDTPVESSMLDIDASTKGLLIPRVAITNLNSSAPIAGTMAESLLVYNINSSTPGIDKGFYYWSGSAWVKLTTGADDADTSLYANDGTVTTGTGFRTVNLNNNIFGFLNNTTDNDYLFLSPAGLYSNEYYWSTSAGLGLAIGTSDAFVVDANRMATFTTASSPPAVNSGSLVIKHETNDGSGVSSIVFPSASNANSDYGYLSFADDGSTNGSTAENGLLTLGVQNDGTGVSDNDVDNINIASSGGLGISNTAPNMRASIDMGQTNKGILINRVALTATNNSAPIYGAQADVPTGLLVFNTVTASSGSTAVTPGFYYWASGQWNRLQNNSTTATTLYNSDSSLTGARTVNLNGNNLSFSNGANLGLRINAANRSLALGAYGSGSNTGTATYGLAVDASGNLIEESIASYKNNLYNIDGSLTGARTINLNGSSLSVSNGGNLGLRVNADRSIDLGAYGSGSILGTPTQILGVTSAGRIVELNTQAAYAAANQDWYDQSTNAAATNINNNIYTNGRVRLASYGSGGITGTATRGLAVDANGNIIEEDIASYKNNIYTANGTLTGARTVNLNGNNLSFNSNNNNSSVSIANNGGVSIIQENGTGASATNGSLILRHRNNLGESSIIFPSAVNYGSDYGYIRYQDDGSTGSTSENGLLEIGIENDVLGSNVQDDIKIRSTGSLLLDMNGAGNDFILTDTSLYPTNDGQKNLGLTTNHYNTLFINGGLRSSDATNDIRVTLGANPDYYFTQEAFYGDITQPDGEKELGLAANRWGETWVGFIHYNGAANDSDRRLKENIKPLSLGLETVNKLASYQYNFINDKKKRERFGFIAQDVQEFLPEIVEVGDDPEKMLGLNYTDLIPVLVNAIKEQQAIIDGQNSKIDSLEASIEEIKAMLTEKANNSETTSKTAIGK